MKITSLGHSCVVLELENSEGEPIRVLVDPWLSDHATGDAMGRFPRLRFHSAALGPLHGVFLSHAHCDHLDPYTLVRLWTELDHPPALLLPVTLAFLLPVFEEHLPNLDVRVLPPNVSVDLHGVKLLGFYDVGDEPNNEDDVMVLVVTAGSERVVVEADARLSLEIASFRAYVGNLLDSPAITSAVFLTTENELTGTMESHNCETPEDRTYLADLARHEMMESVQHLYAPANHPEEVWKESVLRVVHGQGLSAPHELDPRWHHILFPVSVQDRLVEERRVAAELGLSHRIEGFTVGHVHTVEDGRITAREPLSGVTLLDDDRSRVFQPDLDFFPDLPVAPLRSDARDHAPQHARIDALLNTRFIAYLHGMRRPAVLHLLASLGGTYRIRVFFGSTLDDAVDYTLGFGSTGFVAGSPDEAEVHEAYWANDLDDFLDGRCDEFSTSCRTQFPTESMRLWSFLATPMLNSALVYKRVAHHFARAAAGDSPGDWVLPLHAMPEA